MSSVTTTQATADRDLGRPAPQDGTSDGSTKTEGTDTTDAPLDLDALRDLLGRRDTRPAPPSVSQSVRAMAWRSLTKVKHTPEQLFDVTGFPVLMVLLFAVLFGGSVAGSIGDYVQYLVPGILVMSVLMTTIYTGMTLHVDLRTGVLDRFRTLPIWRPSVFVGYLVADALRYLIASLSIVAVGLVFGLRPAGGILGVAAGIGLVLVVAFAISWVWTAVGLMVSDERTVTSISMAVLFPLCFVSNILVDPATLPGWLRAVVQLSPITNTVTSVRTFFAGAPDLTAVAVTLGYAVVIMAIFGALTMRAYNRR